MPDKEGSTPPVQCIQVESVKATVPTPDMVSDSISCDKMPQNEIQSVSIAATLHPTSTISATNLAESEMILKKEQGRDDEESHASRHSHKNSSMRNAIPPSISCTPKEPTKEQDLLPKVLELIQSEIEGESRWSRLIDMLEEDPSIARRQVPVICQGENTSGHLIHYLLAKRKQKPTPIFVFDALVTASPSCLAYKDPRGGRLPLHIAVISPFCSKACSASRFELVKYLAEAYPQALHVADKEGNTPLHYAATLHGSDIIQLLINLCPKATSITNGRDRYPIHLLCARCMDDDGVVHRDDIAACTNAYPEALRHVDRFGRTPLHLICTAQNLWRWDMLEVLIYKYPQALIIKDKTKKTPLGLAKRNSTCKPPINPREDDGVVLSSLAECTARERRKNSSTITAALLAPTTWMHTLSPRKQQRQPRKQPKDPKLAELQNCYG